MNKIKINFRKNLHNLKKKPFEFLCFLVTFYDRMLGHVHKKENRIKLEDWHTHTFLQLHRLNKDFKVPDYQKKFLEKDNHCISMQGIENLRRLFLHNNNLKNAVILFIDKKNNLRMTCYNQQKGFIISTESWYEIECLLRHKEEHAVSHVREYYFAFLDHS